MEIIKKSEIKILSNPSVESFQLLNPENSKSERISITRVFVQPNNEQPRHKHDTSEQIQIAVNGKGILLLADNKEEVFETGDVVRFADGDIHGLKNNSQDVFEYISITDHDNCKAYKELENVDVRKYYTGKIIPGIEIKCSYKKRYYKRWK